MCLQKTPHTHTGTGTGGDSIYGQPFKDEFHTRLRFSRRGLVACANANEPNTNGSQVCTYNHTTSTTSTLLIHIQFFITLDRADGLDRKHTIFGRIAGVRWGLFMLACFRIIFAEGSSIYVH